MRYTPTVPDIQTVLELYSWVFDLTKSKGPIEVGLFENGEFRSFETPGGDKLKILFQLISSNEGKLILIGDGTIDTRLLKQLGVFHRSYALPNATGDHFELIKFSSDPGEQGWPQKLVVRVKGEH